MAFWKYVRPGPGVAFVQKVSVTGPLEDEPPPLLLGRAAVASGVLAWIEELCSADQLRHLGEVHDFGAWLQAGLQKNVHGRPL